MNNGIIFSLQSFKYLTEQKNGINLDHNGLLRTFRTNIDACVTSKIGIENQNQIEMWAQIV